MEEVIKMKNRVIDVLRKDARKTPKQLATLLGRKEEAVKNEIKGLEKKGILLSYTAVVNREKLDKDYVQALIEVKVKPEKDVGYEAVAERISKFKEVSDLYLVSGEYDFLVVVEGNSMKEVSFFVAKKLAPLEQVTSTATRFVLKQYKQAGIQFFEGEKAKRLMVSP